MRIIYSNTVLDLLDNITEVLAQKYLSYYSEAKNYVDDLTFATENDIQILGAILPKAGKKYQTTKYGKPTHFVRYKANARTTWYILVRIEGDTALVTYIHNSHDKIHSIAKVKMR